MAHDMTPHEPSPEAKRNVVRRYLARHPDVQLREAVYALQLIYQPDHLDLLFGMAERARQGYIH